jgi:hypothetical protein
MVDVVGFFYEPTLRYARPPHLFANRRMRHQRTTADRRPDEAFEKAGAKRPIICDSSWSSDQWSFAGVEEFPNIEAVQNYMAALNELNWFRYVEATSILGTKFESKLPPASGKK